jgi:long-chain acyl-CoA synthetase
VLIADILENSAGKYADKCAVRYNGLSFSYGQFAERVAKLACALEDLGVGKGDNVALLCANSHAYLEAVFAAASIGAVSVHFNMRLAAPVTGQLLDKSRAKVVFCSGGQAMPALAYRERHGDKPVVVAVEDAASASANGEGEGEGAGKLAGMLAYEELLAGPARLSAKERWQAAQSVSPSDTALILFTSGTTGIPKGVMHSQQNVTLQVMISAMEGRVSHHETVLCVLPLYHTTMISALQALYVGAELVIGTSPKLATIAEAIIAHNVTRVTLVPYLMNKLASYVHEEGIILASLRTINYGAEPMTPELVRRCQRQFACNFHEGYGMTETMATVTTLMPEHHNDASKLLTVGKPCFGVRLRIVTEDGELCAAGEEGEILVHASTLMQGYWDDPEQTAKAIQDGWYRTGDIGCLDEEGFLRLKDRKQNLVITGGENVYPQEVSSCIRSMGEQVLDAEVFGIPDAQWGEALVAAVVLEDGCGITAADVVAHCAEHLACYKKPREVYFVQSIPRGPTGKLLAAELKCQIEVMRDDKDKE